MGIQSVDRADGVEVRELKLSDLVSRPDRCGVLSARARGALRRRLASGEPCPALVVRRHPRREGQYEILDGQCRAEVLRDLGVPAARCEIWPATDDEAELLAITLNHLRGGADARRRALAAGRIVRRLGEKAAAEELGLTPARLRQWLRPLAQAAVKRSPAPSAHRAAGGDLAFRPLVFHVTPAEAETIERALRGRGPGTTPSGPRARRGEALAKALSAQAKGPSPINKKSERPNPTRSPARAGL
jgi:DNA-binding transcriptional regulator YdaS (Cro superfamily)